jgi:Domain of unknown function (DUF5060)/Protein of unknown function (DUF4038)/Putative collagen-binding domain of a collagenase
MQREHTRTSLVLALACAGLMALAPPSLAVDVGLYDVFETTVTNAKTYSNPFDFTVIELRATFTSPTGETTAAYGFYDGDGSGGQTGSVWKLRFMPDKLGTWSYTTTWSDGTAGGSGTFRAVSSTNPGPLRLDPAHPHSVMHANGNRFFWNGDTEWFFLSDAFTSTQRSAAVDFLASKKVNNFLMVMVNDDTYDVYPWVSTSDRMRFQLQRMRRWEATISQMKASGIMADLWFYSDDSAPILPAANSLEEDTYFKYIIARFSAYSNVVWNLGLEYEEYRSSSWVTARAQFVKTRDPFDRLIGVHRTDTAWPFAGNSNLDHTSLQSLGLDHSSLNSVIIQRRSETASAGRAIPIMFEEFYIEGSAGSLEQYRRGLWAITLGGGYYKGASLGWWIGTPYSSAQHFDVARILYERIITIPYWQMAPNNAIVSRGYALVRQGSEYLIYLPLGGSVDVNLSAASGSITVEWFNPRTGSIVMGSPITGGATRQLVAPDTNDWVLYLTGSGGTPPDVTPPSAPYDLAVPN